MREEIAKLPAAKRLANLFDGRDMSRSARHLLAALAEMTAVDFRLIQSGKERMPEPMAYGMDGAFGAAFAKSYAERWLTVDEAGAMAALRELVQKSQGVRRFSSGILLAALVELRPAQAVAELLKLEPDDDSGPVSGAVQLAFSQLGKSNPADARLLLDQCRAPALRKLAEAGIAMGVAVNDPVSGAALAQQSKLSQVFGVALAEAEKMGAGIVLSVVERAESGWLSSHERSRLIVAFPNAAWETLDVKINLYENSQGVESGVIDATRLLSAKTRENLLSRVEKFPASVRMELKAALLSAWAADAPREAANWAVQNPAADPKENARALTLMFGEWNRRQPEQAKEWWSTLPPGDMREHLDSIASAKPPPSGADFRVKAAAAVKESQSTAVSVIGPLNMAMAEWVAKEPEAAAEWARVITNQDERDRAFAAYAGAAARKDADAAKEWAEAVSPGRMKERAAADVYLEIHRSNPTAAREWVSGLQGVHPLWKQWMLRHRP